MRLDELVEDLRRSSTVADPADSLATVAPSWDDSPPIPSPAPGPSGDRYRKIREHAQGGLGVVYLAKDGELNREVALKEIRDSLADLPLSRSRFLLEAEVTGGLEHPGIVPVYGLGHHDDGRPFYAMRFIRGETLLESIARFHGDESLKADPGGRTLALQKLLRRFTDACNAIDYAHSRGVLHRDLKPHNVMIGRYGETLVVDWGLAKAMGHSGGDEAASEPGFRPSSSGDSDATLPGSLVGTPGYMSPEQAAGRLDLLGPASDVYGLGATLYHLLTGRSPFGGQPVVVLLRQVEAGDFPHPRAVSPGLDPALEAICLKAMARDPSGRYASPRGLAEDVERWVAGEPVAAYAEPFGRRLGRWAGRHRTSLVTAATASAVAACLIGGVSWFRLAERQRVDASALDALGRAEGLAIEARRSGDPAGWERAVAEAVRAEDRLESGRGSPAVHRQADLRLESIRAEQSRCLASLEARARRDRMVAALDEARLRVATHPGGLDPRVKHDAYLAAFRDYGLDVATLPVEEAARRVKASPIRDDLLSALDDWSLDETTNVPLERLAEIAQAAEHDPRAVAARAAFVRRDPVELRRIALEAFRNDFGARFRSFFVALAWLDPVGSFSLLESIRREHPDDFWLNHQLGEACLNLSPPKLPEAIVCFSVAAALRPASSGTRYNLGLVLKAAGQLDEARAALREAVRINPGDAQALVALGHELAAEGSFAEALAVAERGQEIGSRRPNWHDPSGSSVREIRQVMALDARLPAILRGEAQPADAADRVALAVVCGRKGLRAAEARLYAEAFAEQPRLARPNRYLAARAAAKAATGPTNDVPPPDPEARASLRRRALEWLRAELADVASVAEGGTAPLRRQVAQSLALSQAEPDLAGLREESALAALPEPEREAFRSLWAEVEALRRKAEGTAGP